MNLREMLAAHAAWTRNEDGGERANLRDADLRDANLCYADLSGADLRGADLSGADLRGANLRDAALRDADLRDANLCYADLSGADLRGADLRDADLRDANLRDAALSGANLRDAALSGANLRDANVVVAGQDARGYLFYAYPVDDGAVRVRAGCRIFALPDAITHWSQAHADDPVLQADCLSLVRRIEIMARARGWIVEVQP